MNANPALHRPVIARTRSAPHEERLRLERRIDGQLWAVRGEEATAVWVCRCFPWTEPGRYVSLRDTEENEGPTTT